MWEGFCSCSTTAASGGSPKATMVHVRAKREAVLVKSGDTDAFSERLGGEGLVNGFPVEKIKDLIFLTVEFVEFGPRV